jgi:hypothetical protein
MPTIPELKALLKQRGVCGYSKKNKAELESMVAKSEQNVGSNEQIVGSNEQNPIATISLSLYDETVSEIIRIAKQIKIVPQECEDGRIDSAMKEKPFLEELKRQLLEDHPTWDIVISPPRATCDIMVNSLQINLKLTTCKSAENSANKPSIYYSITGLTNYPYSSNWNYFLKRLCDAKINNQIKTTRHRQTEYHYLAKNKLTGEVLLKPIFDIHTYISSASNDLQINWKNEFIHSAYVTTDDEYIKKVQELLITIQKSVMEVIERTRQFAEADIKSLVDTAP